jgi:hypothetical protein
LEVVEIEAGADAFDSMSDRARGLMVEPNHEHPGMGAWRVGADVSQTPIKGQRQPAIGGRAGQYHWVLGATEPLGPSGVHVVANATQGGDDGVRQVLVELEPQRVATAGNSSRASSAP